MRQWVSIDQGRKITTNGSNENFFYTRAARKKRIKIKKDIYRRQKMIK